MRLTSLVVLANQTREVLLRFPSPWVPEFWLGLPLTFGLTLLAEERHWSPVRSAALNAAGAALLLPFYLESRRAEA